MVLVCALSDAALIAVGVVGFGAASKASPWLGEAVRLGGVAFLVVYGALRFRAAARGGASAIRGDSGAAGSGSDDLTFILKAED